MHSEDTVLPSRLILIRIVVTSDELVMMLPPGEYVAPVTQVVRNDRQSVSPGFHDRFYIVQ